MEAPRHLTLAPLCHILGEKIVSRLLSSVSHIMSPVYHVSCLNISCLTSPVSCLLSLLSCLLFPVKSPVSCLLSYVFCPTSPASCLLSHVSCPMHPKEAPLALLPQKLKPQKPQRPSSASHVLAVPRPWGPGCRGEDSSGPFWGRLTHLYWLGEGPPGPRACGRSKPQGCGLGCSDFYTFKTRLIQ